MKITFHPEASLELVEAAQFYDSRQEGLGNRFLDALDNALEAITEDPLLWRPDSCGRRQYLIWRFPYQLIYRIEKSQIIILAVAHAGRKPGYWKHRDQ